MKFRTRFVSILAALLTSLSILPAHAALVTLHSDNFADILTGNSTSSTGSNTSWPGAGRYIVTNAYQAGGAVRIGKTDAPGSITTTNLAMQAGSLRVQVQVKGWTTVEGQLRISVAGQSTNIVYTAVMAGSFETVAANFVVPNGTNTVTFATTAKRCYLDDIVITQNISSTADEPVFSVNMQSSTTVQELTEVAFNISAVVGETPTTVSYVSGLPVGASYTFVDGDFAWTAALGQAAAYPLVFSAVGGDSQTYPYTVNITVDALPLTSPTDLSASNITEYTFDAWWNSVAAATEGYVVDAWYGSSSPDTLNSDLETFFETTDNNPVQPLGWSFTEISAEYMDKGLTEISLNDNGDTIVTKFYRQFVTNLSFRIQGRSTTTASDSALTVFGSANGADWTQVARYSSLSDGDGDDENNIFTTAGGDLLKNIALPLSSGYRTFKFVYTKAAGNVGIGNIAAMYDGAGAKFLSGWQGAATLATASSIDGAKPGTVHYVRVGAKNATETKYTTISVKTLDAPKATVISVR